MNNADDIVEWYDDWGKGATKPLVTPPSPSDAPKPEKVAHTLHEEVKQLQSKVNRQEVLLELIMEDIRSLKPNKLGRATP
jgi:hypothetical protein